MKTKLFAIALLLVSTLSATAGTFPFAFWKASGPSCTDQVFTVQSSTLTGSVIRHGMSCSPNGVYCFGVALEAQASFAFTYHFYYSKDAGLTWTKYAYTQTNGASGAILEDTLHGYAMTPQIVVADNGKAASIISNSASGLNYHVKGVYSDISAGSPVVTDTAAIPIDAENNQGTAGFICANTTGNRQAWLEGDKTDLSFLVVACVLQNDTVGFRFFTNGGATYQNSDLGGYSHYYGSRVGLAVTGSGSSHRVHAYNKNGATNLQYRYYDQPSATAVGSGTVATGDYYLYDCDSSATKGYCLIRDNSTDAANYYSWNATGSPTYSSLRTLQPQLDLDDFIGLNGHENTSGQAYNYGKIPGPQIVINPSDSNHVYFMLDQLHLDGAVRPEVYEVRDDTAFLGVAFSSDTASGTQELYFSTTSVELAQTFTGAATRFRGASFTMRQVGTIAPGSIVYAELQNTTAGAPNDTVVATSLNSIDPRKLSRDTSGERVHFNFNTQTLTGVYAVVLKATYPTGSDHVQLIGSTNGITAGIAYRKDTGVWTSTGADVVCEINSEWVYDYGQTVMDRAEKSGTTWWGADSSIGLKDSSTLSMLTRAFPSGLGVANWRQAGHTYRSTIAMGSGSAASTPSTQVIAGYDPTKFDSALIYASDLGTTESARKDAVTGVASTTEMAEDRSGINASVSAYTSVTFGNQAAFTSGKSGVFNTTSSKIVMDTANVTQDLLVGGSPFFIEAEFMLNTLPSVKGNLSIIASKFTDGVGFGWWLWVTTGNNLLFGGTSLTDTIGTTVLTTGVRYVVRVTGDGATVRLYLNGIEQAYFSQNTSAYSFAGNSSPLCLGNVHNTSIYGLGGEIGFIKIGKGSATQVATGYYSQPEMLHPINAGKISAFLQGIGTGSTTINTGFNQWGTLVPNSCFP